MARKCVYCNNIVEQSYCAHCGERKFSRKDLSFKNLILQLFESATDIDGNFVKSFRYLLFRPGQLTQDYLKGIRTHRLNPFQLFIFCNVIYFLFISVIHQNAFTTPLNVHQAATNFIHQELAVELVSDKLPQGSITEEEFTKQFNLTIELHSKSLLILLVPLFSLFCFLGFWGEKNRGVLSLIFASHFVSVFIVFLILFGVLSFFISEFLTLLSLDKINKWLLSDVLVSSALVVFSCGYLYLALKKDNDKF